jgi:hypothetical protein
MLLTKPKVRKKEKLVLLCYFQRLSDLT